ncbi:hypothetical protein PISMIDRAFT_13433 [Pisolithus microcarpus 441]|uniref:Uncharacterized protein n=1 Tax=Pisolithus microcarpus 441 TaxID=765257 RepID=A0A0C9ZIG5_9AGAM|nr:hypothetical protein PISMIDRAFT_13433 [Pisolithus microcarpus 441]
MTPDDSFPLGSALRVSATDMDSSFDMLVDGLADEVFNIEMETRSHEPVTELYSGASANYG